MARRFAGVVIAVALVIVLGAIVFGAIPSASNGGQANQFTVGTAIVIAGYVAFPVLALLAVGLLVIALLVGVAGAMERGNKRDADASGRGGSDWGR
jgi:hypothetical protein